MSGEVHISGGSAFDPDYNLVGQTDNGLTRLGDRPCTDAGVIAAVGLGNLGGSVCNDQQIGAAAFTFNRNCAVI